ncbi:MAG: NAD(P)-dependent oxidoreductase [Kiloniellales bacterium]
MTIFSKIALVGVGNMGGPMAVHLAKAAERFCVYDLRGEVAAKVAADSGGTVAATLAEAAEGADLVVTMLPSAEVVRNVLFGPGDCLTERLPKGALVVDMSSSYPPTTQQTGAELAEHGATLLDAPVSGGVKRAVTGELAIMLGGDDAAALDRAQPALETMGRIFRSGRLGSGHALKALNNYVSAAGLTAACAALQVGERFGLDPTIMIDTINASTGRNNATEVKFHPFIIPRDFSSGFALDLMAKDLKAAGDLAEELGLDLPPLQQEVDLWARAKERLAPGADHTEVFRYLEAQAGKGHKS